MRVHITLDRDLVAELDRRAGPRGRSAWIETTIRRSLEDERRWDQIESAIGSLGPDGGVWDEDSAAWVHDSRRADPRSVG